VNTAAGKGAGQCGTAKAYYRRCGAKTAYARTALPIPPRPP